MYSKTIFDILTFNLHRAFFLPFLWVPMNNINSHTTCTAACPILYTLVTKTSLEVPTGDLELSVFETFFFSNSIKIWTILTTKCCHNYLCFPPMWMPPPNYLIVSTNNFLGRYTCILCYYSMFKLNFLSYFEYENKTRIVLNTPSSLS